MEILKRIKSNIGRTLRSWAPDDDRWYPVYQSMLSASGEDVNEFTAMQHGAVFACVQKISGTIATLPLELYKRDEKGRSKAYDHPLYSILHDQPNKDMTSSTWRRLLVINCLLNGNHYDFIERSNGGAVLGLIPLNPQKVKIKRTKESQTLYYEYEKAPGDYMIIPQENMLHTHGISRDGISGMSTIEQARNAIGLGISTEKFGSHYFKNGARPGLAIELQHNLSDQALLDLKESFIKNNSGENQLGVHVLRDGAKLTTYNIPNSDSQFLESRKFQVEDIARIFDVPLSMIQYLHAAFKSNVEQENIGYVTHSIRPRIVDIEQTLNWKLLQPGERKTYFIELNLDGLLRGDSLTQARVLDIEMGNAVINPNEWRKLKNWNPILDENGNLDPAGNKYQKKNIWMDLGAKGVIPQPPPPAPPAPETKSVNIIVRETRASGVADRNKLRAQFEPVFLDSAKRIVKIEVNDLRRAIKRYFPKRGLNEFETWLEGFYDKFTGKIEQNMKPMIQTYGGAIAEVASKEAGGDGTVAGVNDFAAGYVDVSAARYAGSSLGQLNKIIREATPEDVEAALLERLDEWDEKRAGKFAGRENVEASDAFAKLAFISVGVTELVWMAQGNKPCPYCEELNGTVVGIEKVFVPDGGVIDPANAEGTMQVSGAKMHAPLHGGCVCTVVPG